MTQVNVAESCFDQLGTVECTVKAVECQRQALTLAPNWHVRLSDLTQQNYHLLVSTRFEGG